MRKVVAQLIFKLKDQIQLWILKAWEKLHKRLLSQFLAKVISCEGQKKREVIVFLNQREVHLPIMKMLPSPEEAQELPR